MKNFVYKILILFGLFAILLIFGLLLPATPRASKSLLMAQPIKDSLLIHTPSPRIILVGGSNLSFGIDSKMIKDSLHLNPINTAIHKEIGLQFMMKDVIRFIQSGDIVLLIPEYDRYYKSKDDVSTELLRMVIDVNKKNIELLSPSQMFHLIPYLPKNAFSRFKLREYKKEDCDSIYSIYSFNNFGDVNLNTSFRNNKVSFSIASMPQSLINQDVLNEIKEFQVAIHKRGASLLISYPCIQDSSYDNCLSQINNVNNHIEKLGIPIIGNPIHYRIPDSLMLNTPYHLTSDGAKYRTSILIKDLNQYFKNKK